MSSEWNTETVKKWWKVIAVKLPDIRVYNELNRHVQMKVADKGMNNSDEESLVM